jgi:small-conductance mechanosensitive channel
MLRIPNSLVTQSLILNLSHGRQSNVGTQFEVPIHIDPDELHRKLRSHLSKDKDFSGQEQMFELIEISPAGCLVAVNYGVEKGHEREMKPLLLKALRLVLADYSNEKDHA